MQVDTGTGTQARSNLYPFGVHMSARTRTICNQPTQHGAGLWGRQRTMLIRPSQETLESEMSAGSSNSEFNKHIPVYVRGIERADV